ncbi:unnamed protein product, partial [Candidula unifasciata]
MQDVRIIVGNFDQVMARRVFCSARKNSLYGPKHQWIILGTYDDDWWTIDDPMVTCSTWELNDTIHGYLATDALPLSTSDDVTESGLTASEYLHVYNKTRGSEFSKYHGYAYDGVWVVAKALDRLLEAASLTPDLLRGPEVGRVLNETNFVGVTGRVQFQNGDRLGSITISQMQYGRMVKVGEYHALTHTLDLGNGSLITWRDGKPPMDRSVKIEELRHVSFPVYIAFVVLAAMGITMAVLFLAVNIRYRRHSPNMNNLIIVGCILCYMSIFLLGADPDHTDRLLFSYWCTARSWTLALGFTLAFGAMFGKTWRVHAIFTNIKLNKKVIKDYKLMLIVLVLVLLDVLVLVTWQVVDPFDKAVKRLSPEVGLSPEVYADYEIIPKLDYCSSRRMEIWLGALYAYKGLLLAFGCFLAWETRHVSIPALNDSKYIGMSVYNVVIMCVCGAAVSFIIEDRPTESFIIIGLFIIFCTTITLCLVFLPKIVQLKRNPKGNEQRVRATLGHCSKQSKKTEYSVHREKMRETLEENRRLRGFLEQRASELENLLEQLGDDVIKDDVGLRSALIHKTVLDLRNTKESPGKMSLKSCSASDYDSSYSEGSGTTYVYLNDEPAPTTSLLKYRFNNSKLYSEAIEMAGIRFNNRKTSLTLPPASEDEVEDDPFGGVYLGPIDSPTNPDAVDGDASIEERYPLMIDSPSNRELPHRPESATSGDSLLDSFSGAPGLRTSFGSTDTNPGTLVCSMS